MEYCVLGSGSGGNSTLVRYGKFSLLIDAGLSARKLSARLEFCGLHPSELSAILLTHEHGDHVQGARLLCEKYAIPLYCNSQTAHVLRAGAFANVASWKIFQTGQRFDLGPLEVSSFAVPHDAVEPVAFTIRNAQHSLCVLTDLGHVTNSILERISGISGLVLEANYDEALLEADTKRPWSVKQRISSRHGHLANSAAADIVSRLATNGLSSVVLAHLSRDCNAPDVALNSIRSRLETDCAVHLYCASQDEPTPMIYLGSRQLLQAEFAM